MVTIDNAEDYVDFMFDVCMQNGVQKQMEAFRSKCHIDPLQRPLHNKLFLYRKASTTS